jgi:uncharacterized protein YjbI with pentapeptide repeats
MTAPQDVPYRTRWQTSQGKELAQEVWRLLMTNEPLRGLNLANNGGRIDLRGIVVPEVTKEKLPPFRNWGLQRLEGWLEFRNVKFENIDFAGSDLRNARFFNSIIAGCRFDNADCENWSLKATDVIRTTFVRTRLREAALGPWYEGHGNRYEFVDFSHADMRGLSSTTATYVDCNFSNARLEKLEFQSSSFIRCHFAGELREVLFYDRGFKTGKPDPNPMEDVDFSQAKLRWVEFRHLNLDRVRLPDDRDHLIIKNYRCVLEKAIAIVKSSGERYAPGIAAVLQNRLKWIGPRQEIGIINRLDFRESGGEEEEHFLVESLRRAAQECCGLSIN